jgi:hypothetical protein
MVKNYISNKDESQRMFKNNFLEALSKVHWTTPLWIFLPLILYFMFISIFELEIVYYNIIAYFIFGLLIWTLTEYTLHRFVFHYKARSGFGKNLHFIFHGVHHDYPNDLKRLVMPPSVSIPLATFFYFLFKYFLGDTNIYPFFFRIYFRLPFL